MELSIIDEYIEEFANSFKNQQEKTYKGGLKIGVDLGTANIVMAAVDKKDTPIAGACKESKVVKDGLVVDYVNAVRIVKDLKDKMEKILKTELNYAATAIPPGIIDENAKVMTNVVEAAGLDVTNVVDEPTAAATVLQVDNGAIVDIGGGTTGISILEEGKVVYTADEPTGGTHMNLVLAGNYGVSSDEAEILKKNTKKEKEIFTVVRPVVEKMANIVKNHIDGFSVDCIYVAGGACNFSNFEQAFTKYIGVKTIKPLNPLLVTPLGIALNCKQGRWKD